MAAGGDLAGTVDYAGGWLVLAVVLAAAAVSWNVGVLVWGRPRRLAEAARPAPRDPAVLRARYLELIDQVEADHARGLVDHREAHRRLSLASRGFVQELTGRTTLSMTLTDLRERDLSGLVAVVENAYPPVFSPSSSRPEHELATTLHRARAAVESTWS